MDLLATWGKTHTDVLPLSKVGEHFSKLLPDIKMWLFSCEMLHYIHQLAANIICYQSQVV